MLEVIEKLLILQERDRHLMQMQAELSQIGPEREALKAKAAATQASLDAAKHRVKQTESDRKRLELDVATKKELILRYSNQQLETRKNEEYRALAHEIETCKAEIFKIEDQEIELMEQAEAAQKTVAEAAQEANDAKQLAEQLMADLATREQNLQKEQADLITSRDQLAAAVEEVARSRYERLFISKGGKVVVGVQHGVCGGCHMKLQAQLLVTCQARKELVTCSNCGRILYYTRDMDLAVVD